jgi:hypothetical protein
MPKLINRVGETYGRLTVVEHCGKDKYNQNLWSCKCICGNVKVVSSSNLGNGRTNSCGCLVAESRKIKHGKRKSPIYSRWIAMKARCYNENHEYFHNYGGRGITVCEDWLDFQKFYEDMHESFSPDLDIDRIDVNLGYSKDNCRWVDKSEGNFNKNIQKNNNSGKTGVSLNKKSGRWRAYITWNKQQIFLGSYLTIDEAIRARLEAELKYYGYTKI